MSQATPEVPSDDGPADCVNCGERIRRFGQTRRWCHDQTGNVQCSPEWWGVAEAASHCGIRPGTWRDYVARGFAPPPDDPDEGAPRERRRPRWRPETVTSWHASRPRARSGVRLR